MVKNRKKTNPCKRVIPSMHDVIRNNLRKNAEINSQLAHPQIYAVNPIQIEDYEETPIDEKKPFCLDYFP